MLIDLNEHEYEKELKVIDIKQAVFLNMTITLPIFVVFGAIFYRLHKDVWLSVFSIPTDWFIFTLKAIAALMVYILGVVLHELIHGATWAIFLKDGFKSIKFGVIRKFGTPYCHCKQPMKIKHYILGGIMPSVILGIIPTICGLINGNFWLMLFGIIFTVAAMGDFMVVRTLITEKMDDYAEDHPFEAGCYVYRIKSEN